MRLSFGIVMAFLAAGLSAQVTVQVGGTSYLGIGVADITAERAKVLNLKEERGAEVTNVAQDSPAAKAGIKEADVVLDYDGTAVHGIEQLTRLVRETPVGRQVKIAVWRNAAALTLTATIEARKGTVIRSRGFDIAVPFIRPPQIEIPRFQMTWQNPVLGIEGESLRSQEQLADFFGVKDGVLVKLVRKNSAAEKAGIKAGDVVVKVDDSTVATPQEITRALRALVSKKTFTVTVVRNKKEMSLTVTMEERGGAIRPADPALQCE
ncbi:MAG: PDZ domain-containing protein [Bryobacteraceae bacterium]